MENLIVSIRSFGSHSAWEIMEVCVCKCHNFQIPWNAEPTHGGQLPWKVLQSELCMREINLSSTTDSWGLFVTIAKPNASSSTQHSI